MENLLSMFLDGISIMAFLALLHFFTQARSVLMERWGVRVAEDYIGMSLEDYRKKLEKESK